MLAYSVALKAWPDRQKPSPSRCIAAVLVNREHSPVCWARNAVDITNNGTSHAEVRLLTNYLNQVPQKHATGTRLYVTLEPCAMCAGMIAMSRADGVIYGQTADGSGRAMERLTFDSSPVGGYPPYSWAPFSAPAPTKFRRMLDRARREYRGQQHWHDSSQYRAIIERAAQALQEYSPKHEENREVVRRALAFLAGVPREYQALPYDVQCPPKASSSPK